LPQDTFVVHWSLHDCWPLGETSMGFDGDLLLRIRPDGDGYTSSIEPHRLSAIVDGQRYSADDSFTAHLPAERAWHAE
jgi:hypothetical protein